MKTGTIEQQILIEEEAQNKHIQKYLNQLSKAIKDNRFDETPEGLILVKLGYENFRDKITEYLGVKLTGTLAKQRNFMKLMSDDPEELALIALRIIIANSSGKVSMVNAGMHISKELIKLHFFNRLKKDNPKLLSYLGQEYKRASKKRKDKIVSKHINKLYKIDFDNNLSDASLGLKVGITLIDLFINSGANIIVKYRKIIHSKTQYFLKLTDEAEDILTQMTDKEKLLKNSNMIPMIVEPLDWEDTEAGGYYYHQIPLVKTWTKQGKTFVKENDMTKVIDVINKIQKVPWRVNKDILEIVDKIFYENIIDPKSSQFLPRCIGGLPSSKKYEAKELIEETPGYNCETKEELEKWGKWNKKRESVQIELDAESSRRLDLINSLNTAHRVKDYKKIWFVLQLDYRGRVYYHNQFFNPQSKGYVKAMLEFSEGVKLNGTGIKWFKIHTANVFGKDKELLENRIKWFNDNEEDIIKIGNNPMENKALWIYSDSPFEYVVACMSWVKHLNGEEIHLPIQLDATNSGTQFYSGLVLDKEGAESVNVVNKYVDGEIVRADIYQDVADLVNKKLTIGDYTKNFPYQDSEGEIFDRWTNKEALSITNKITRKHTKKNTMTVPYSVTNRGMMDQNWSMMKDYILNGNEFWEGDDWVVNKLITELNEKSIYEIIKGAKMGQTYLKEVASKLDRVATWKSPLYNFPVLQPSFKKDEERVVTPLGKLTLKLSNEVKLNKQKQLSSIAANFIHSLDSSLLMYCIDNATNDIGIIHDCFLVHPNDAEELRFNYSEGYIEIMETNPLKVFQDDLNLKEEDKVEVPCIGTLDLKEVRKSLYAMS